MPGITTFDQGGLAAALVASSQLGLDVGLAPENGDVPPGGDGQAQPDPDARAGVGSGRRLNIEPRHVAAGSARASADMATGAAALARSPGNWLARLQAGKSKASGAAMAHLQMAHADTAGARPLDSQTTMSLAEEAGIKKKMTVKIYWHPRGQSASRRVEPGAAFDTRPPPAMPPITEKLASQVAAHMQGHASKRAEAYLAELAVQQKQLGESALATLAGMLGVPAPPLNDGGVPAESGMARQAAEAWLLADYLQSEGRPQPLFITRLNRHIDGVLDTLPPDALSALYRRVTIDSTLTLPPASSTLAGQAGTFFNAVGMLASRSAWAASRICDLVEKPLSPPDLGVVLRNAVSVHKPDAAHDETALMSVAGDISRLTVERGQYLLMRQLRLRAGKMLHDKGIPFNPLIGIATTVLPQANYARNVAGTLRRTLASGPIPANGQPAHYVSDEEIRQRLATSLEQFSNAELRAAAGNLLSGHTAHMRRLVQEQGEQSADRATLGRQFTILCEVLADKLAQSLGDGSGLPAWQTLRGWDWDQRLSRDTHAASAGGLAGLGRTVLRGAQRLLASLFSSGKSDRQQMREAYAEVMHAASGFIDAVHRNRMRDTNAELDAGQRYLERAGLLKESSAMHGWTSDTLRLFNESGARLLHAAHRYQVLRESPGGRLASAELQLAGDPDQLIEAAFCDAIAKTPGARVNVLGETLFDPGWLKALHGLQEIKHQSYQTGRSRPARSALGRLLNRDHIPWRPTLGMADARALLFALQRAVGKEAGTRASAEILRALGRDRTGGADGSAAPRADGTPGDEDLRLLDDIRTLEQRFRPLDQELLATDARPGVDSALDRFIGMGMKRLSATERGRIDASVFSLDRRPPAWLEEDDVWQAVARCFQDRGGLL